MNIRSVLAATAALVLVSLAARAEPAPTYEWSSVPRVIAFADVHGAYDELGKLLQSAGIVDASMKWTAGNTHLVSVGDLLDRGDESRKVIDLLMRLQGEAAAAGGRLHLVIGNHEAMNVLGDLRYITATDFASYSADEPAGMRQELRDAWLAKNGPESGGEFDKRFPPGYFGHRAVFGPEGKYGKWILSQPVALKINDTLFMHGGPSKELQGMSLVEINTRYRTAVAGYLVALQAAEAAGLVLPEDLYSRRPSLAAERAAASTDPDPAVKTRLVETAQKLDAADRNPMIDMDGPNWYRGAALCHEASETDVLQPVLQGLGAKRLVVGHTVARNHTVASRFDGNVIKLDAGMNRAVYKGRGAALFLEGAGPPKILYPEQAGTKSDIPAEPLYVASATLDDAQVSQLLESGNVTVVGPVSPGILDVTVEKEGRQVPAVFIATSDEVVRKEIAAYKVDRLLELGLVPATVPREVQGQRGALQARPAKVVSQAQVDAQKLRGGGWCALPPQFELMYAFDGLVGNEGRTADRILYDASEWMLLLTGHDKGLHTGKALPPHLQARPPQPGPEMRRRLQALEAAKLEAALGDLVPERAIKAMLDRRDQMLKPAAAAAK
jgi:hypothetical protein